MVTIIVISIISSNNNEGFSFFHVDFTELCSCFENDTEADMPVCLGSKDWY